ncbi:hypothetical protein CR513_27586, partial [Mucuna pruriens]
MDGNKGPTQMWVNQTTSDKENVVEHPYTSQVDQDIQAFSKEEMDCLRALLNSTSKSLGSYVLTMKDKSSFNIFGSVPQSIWILDSRTTDHMILFPSYFTSYLKVSKEKLTTVANGDHVPIVGYGNVQLQSYFSLHNDLFFFSNNKSLEPFDLIHSDIWGLASNSISRVKWFVLLRLDNSTEFVNLEFSKFLKDNGVVHELTCVNTPQQNRVAERKNHHLLEVARALLFQMSIPNVYWGEVVLTVTYLINKLSACILSSISSIKHMLSFFPNSPLMLSLSSRVFRCVAFVHSHNPHRVKLDPKAIKCIFIVYPSNKKGFKCYHPLSR